ncbi:MAG: kinase [Dysgonomonas sp.]
MEEYNGILCISGSLLIISEDNPDGIMSLSMYRKLAYTNKREGKKSLNIVRRGCNETPALIEFDSLPPKYKKLAKERFGDPEVESQKEGIMEYLELDSQAIEFFKLHKVGYDDNEKGLPDDVQLLYSNNAAVLNALKKAWDEHVISSKSRNKRPLSGKFWSRAAKAIQNLPKDWRCDLPKNPKRLRIKLEDYIEYGYDEILSGKWGNQNTRIITEEVGDWLVAKWSARVPKVVVSIEQLHALYNKEADERNREAGEVVWKKIKSSVAIRDYMYRPDIEEKWHAARYGELSYKEKFTRQHKTKLASFRDSLWYSDGTKLNFYYQDKDGNTKTANVYEVIDVYSECFLGYYISRTEDFEAQFFAFKMAIQTSKCKPYEIRFDNQGGHKKLENGSFLTTITRHAIKTAPYNGKSKIIESAFGRFQAGYLKEEWYFTGQNITTNKKESRANMEFILANLKNLPTLERVKEVYLEKRTEWNNAPHPATGIPRIEMYETSANDKAQEVDFLDMITMFGITTKDPSTYRSSGILFKVKNTKYEYEVLSADGEPDNDFMRRNIGRKFYVCYDLEDMSIVALYEKDASGMRFVTLAQPYIKVQRNLQEQTNDDKLFIRQMEITNKLQRIANVKQTNERLEKYDLHPNQHGLNAPKPKGINMRKKPIDIGEIQKEVSNMTEIEEQKKAARKAIKKAEKAEKQMQAQEAEDKDEFYKQRARLLELSLSEN